VQRWRKTDRTQRDAVAPAAYSQSLQRPAATETVTSDISLPSHGAEPAKFSEAKRFEPIDEPSGPRLNLIPAGPRVSPASSSGIQLAAFQQSEKSDVQAGVPAVNNLVPQSEPAPWTERTESRPSNRGSVQGVKPNRAPSSLLTRQQTPVQEPAVALPPATLPSLPANPASDDTSSVLPSPPNREPIVAPPNREPTPVPPASELARPEQVVPNPFPQRIPERIPPERMSTSPSDRIAPDDRVLGDDDLPPMPPTRQNRSIANCDEVRNFAMNTDIKNVRVDSSPGFVQGYQGSDRTNSYTKESFVEKAPNRTWYDYDGQVVAQGRLIDLVFGTALIEQADGTRTSYLLRKLSDGDQAYIAEVWGVPVTCSLGDQGFEARVFADSTFTWKATGACHKPLYFEDVQLERYGHEWGPVVQPAISSLNFFGSFALLPYNMGIHPMNECQYPLGYYRPGSCAPWTLGPIPISLRGALSQASVVTGTAWAVP